MNLLLNIRSSATVTRDGILHNNDYDGKEDQGGFKVNSEYVTVTVRKDIEALSTNQRKRSSSFDIDFANIKPCSLDELPPPAKLRKRIPSKPKLEKPVKRLSKSSAVSEHIVSLKRKQLYISNSKPEVSNEACPSSSYPLTNSSHHHQVVPSSPSSSLTEQIEDPALQSFDDIFCPNHSKPFELKSIIMKPGIDFKPRKSLSFDFDQDKVKIPSIYDKPEGGVPVTQSNETLYEEGNGPAGSGSLFLTRQPRVISDEIPIPSQSPFNPVTFGIKNFYPREE
ncbi:PREDICTED: uncharacterized protein LOC109581753 [Amphimedon queenslandica]|uniref:Uncharacterized protein n=1 Tax=Amphimedon queenslandica TaxID=400682 RepID=A0A1X7UXQ0_AMPQE|nr:PREDICTED: uncharacterized protein LOC109581753 [Amphimedon queenslandica]|eukprot:XP_019851691.1 PREDICTED: uncharacterized protein LOC109581753 [Amphimedon queenslandica]